MTSELDADTTHTPVSNLVHVPVSIGELWDKYTILLIKQERIHNHEKRSQVEYELEQLRSFITNIEPHYQSHPAFAELKHVNESLWEIEDSLRVKEANGAFDQEFVDLARQVYYTNDRRAEIKRKINVAFGSAIHEVKEYVQYV
jgi:hypothetical protein